MCVDKHGGVALIPAFMLEEELNIKKGKRQPGVSPATRKALLEAQGGLCARCKAPPGVWGLSVHHKARKGMGGRQGAAREWSDSLENLEALCLRCHSAEHGLRVKL